MAVILNTRILVVVYLFQSMICYEKGSIVGKRCNFRYTQPKYLFTSPGYPEFYPNNVTCVWKIVAGEGWHVLLTIIDLNMEDSKHCMFDSVTIYDGEDEMAIPLRKMCGVKPPEVVRSISNIVTIIFTTDLTQNGKGFQMEYRNVPGCSETFSESSGFISSPGYPLEYPEGIYCTYFIDGGDGKSIKLWFVDFELEEKQYYECFDHISIFTTSKENKEVLSKQYCGKEIEESNLCFNEKQLTLRFVTDDEINYRGFKLKYEIIDHACNEVLSTETFKPSKVVLADDLEAFNALLDEEIRKLNLKQGGNIELFKTRTATAQNLFSSEDSQIFYATKNSILPSPSRTQPLSSTLYISRHMVNENTSAANLQNSILRVLPSPSSTRYISVALETEIYQSKMTKEYDKENLTANTVISSFSIKENITSNSFDSASLSTKGNVTVNTLVPKPFSIKKNNTVNSIVLKSLSSKEYFTINTVVLKPFSTIKFSWHSRSILQSFSGVVSLSEAVVQSQVDYYSSVHLVFPTSVLQQIENLSITKTNTHNTIISSVNHGASITARQQASQIMMTPAKSTGCNKYLSVEIIDGNVPLSPLSYNEGGKLDEVLELQIDTVWEVAWPHEGMLGEIGIMHYGTMLATKEKRWLLYVRGKKRKHLHLLQMTQKVLQNNNVIYLRKLTEDTMKYSLSIRNYLAKIPTSVTMKIKCC